MVGDLSLRIDLIKATSVLGLQVLQVLRMLRVERRRQADAKLLRDALQGSSDRGMVGDHPPAKKLYRSIVGVGRSEFALGDFREIASACL
jgi:hypothetical protein